MNPSAAGWIKKILKQKALVQAVESLDVNNFYTSLRSCGFIYGNNVLVFKAYFETNDYTEEELCKINFLIALKYIHCLSGSKTDFVESTIDFYSKINVYKTSFLSDLLGEKKTTALLEKIIHKRIQIADNIIDKSFNYFITNALLFSDILAYKLYLKSNTISEDYIQQLESVIETIVMTVLNSKTKKTAYDDSLISLFEQSLRYRKESELTYQEAIDHINTNLEAYYIIDMACMATWGDATVDKQERSVLNKLGRNLKLEPIIIKDAVTSLNTFYSVHKNNIALLTSKNLVKTFYDNSSGMVSKLITRNSKRLHNELRESKELMKLLTQSTVRELNDDEHKKVQEQLLDIFKSIPSLAIFMLPGGALLLPLVIKFIPKLLPSAFDDNRIEDEE
ncbi:MAG TPA: LETM1-related biofilm-associated protein [Flavobacteriaceae bacterium]|nr:LETM1-related biofilm-associated protein [Flavobacteriaceae bacterium]